jgi:hypothetical protein
MAGRDVTELSKRSICEALRLDVETLSRPLSVDRYVGLWSVSEGTPYGTAFLEPFAILLSLGYNLLQCQPSGTVSADSKTVVVFQKGQSRQ